MKHNLLAIQRLSARRPWPGTQVMSPEHRERLDHVTRFDMLTTEISASCTEAVRQIGPSKWGSGPPHAIRERGGAARFGGSIASVRAGQVRPIWDRIERRVESTSAAARSRGVEATGRLREGRRRASPTYTPALWALDAGRARATAPYVGREEARASSWSRQLPTSGTSNLRCPEGVMAVGCSACWRLATCAAYGGSESFSRRRSPHVGGREPEPRHLKHPRAFRATDPPPIDAIGALAPRPDIIGLQEITPERVPP